VPYHIVVNVEKKIETPDPHRLSKNFNVCGMKERDEWKNYIPIILFFIVNIVTIIAGCYLSITVRKIRYSAYNETKILLFSVIEN